jgi:phenylacetate-CoA ligase
MTLWNQAYASVVLPLVDPNYRGLGRRMRAYQRWERAPAPQVEVWHLQALQRLLRHAYATCAFYRRRFDAAGLDPERFRHADELRRLPALTRAELRDQGDEIRSRRYAPAQLRPAASGGTTDTPVPLWRDLECLRARHALQQTLGLWAGLRPGDKVFNLWGARSDFAENPSWRWRTYEQVVLRRTWAPISYLTPEVMERHRLALNRFRPRIINAYPTPLALWAEFLLANGREYHRPRAIIATAEALLPAQRRVIEQAFGCPVLEHYGAREFGMIAAQCERQAGLHLHPAAVHVDLEAVGGGGGVRELLVTDLNGYGMPLIRYRVNDCVGPEAAACGCGRPFAVLPAIAGRATDVFRLANGALVPGVSLTNRVLRAVPGLAKTQIIQEALGEFRLRYVPGPGFTDADLQPLQRKLGQFLGEDVRWRLEPVAEIPREANGKTRFCICRLPPPGGPDAARAGGEA